MSGGRVKPAEVREWVGDDVCACGIRRQKVRSFLSIIGGFGVFLPRFSVIDRDGETKNPEVSVGKRLRG